MKFCGECGKSVGAAQKYCSECGTSLDASHAVEDSNLSGTEPPSQVEDSNRRNCEDCKTPLELGAEFCFECGLPVNRSGPALVPEPIPIVSPDSKAVSADGGAAAGLLGALWGGSASCGCGCFSLVFILGFLVLLGAFL